MIKKTEERKPFEKYTGGGMEFKDFEPIIEKYLGKAGKVYFPLLEKEVTARPKRWCDLTYKKTIKATIDFVDLEIKIASEYGEILRRKDVCESEMYPVLKNTPSS